MSFVKSLPRKPVAHLHAIYNYLNTKKPGLRNRKEVQVTNEQKIDLSFDSISENPFESVGTEFQYINIDLNVNFEGCPAQDIHIMIFETEIYYKSMNDDSN